MRQWYLARVFPYLLGMPYGGVPKFRRGEAQKPKHKGGAVVSHRYFADGSYRLKILFSGGLTHSDYYINQVNKCPLLI